MKLFAILLSTLALVSASLGMTVTFPGAGDVVDFASPVTITFEADPGDPPVISIHLVNPSIGFEIVIADNVQSGAGSFTTQPNPSVPDGSGYVIEILDPGRNQVIATSGSFTAGDGGSTGPPGGCEARRTRRRSYRA